MYRRDPQCGGYFLSVQKRSSVWGIFLVCTEEIPSVGDITRVYRRDPQCGGNF